MNNFYVQIDSSSRVFSVSQLASEVNANNLIPIDSLDNNYLGKYYDSNLKQFVEVTAATDKPIIQADGVDTATITADVPDLLSSITFYHAETGQEIQTVTPVNGKAVLQVTATNPGQIAIRAGEWQYDNKNVVVVNAQ